MSVFLDSNSFKLSIAAISTFFILRYPTAARLELFDYHGKNLEVLHEGG